MKVLIVIFLLHSCVSIAPPENDVHNIRGLRTDHSKKTMTKMSRKNHMPAKSAKSSAKGGLTKCPGLSDGSSASPEGNNNRRMINQMIYRDPFVIEGLPAAVRDLDCGVLAYAVRDGGPWKGLWNSFPRGRNAFFIFETDRTATTCVADWFMDGLTGENVLALSNVEENVPTEMYFGSTLNIYIEMENDQVIRLFSFRVGESGYMMEGVGQHYWWIGSRTCHKKDETSLACQHDGDSPTWILRRGTETNTTYISRSEA